ncbi:unnamed protein product [Rotaria sordida]|uniref:Uncharacterized protein n=1 Tax=Rotaria sordida TaxID=392033 RepID=A0A819MDU2_9BILA|nr:unnamed protein product [Rotaria sordida]CAF3978866.1 unnamed protein product [Rotaria sordida]
MMAFNNTYFLEKPLIYHSTGLSDVDITVLTGQIPVTQSTVVYNKSNINHNTSNLYRTANVLRKIYLQNLIKIQKAFKGGKDDVTKWLKDPEYVFDAAYILDINTSGLISCLLQDEAL